MFSTLINHKPMKILSRFLALFFLFVAAFCTQAATTFTLNPMFTFGSDASPVRGDGSIQPCDTMGISPATGLPVIISGPTLNCFWNPGEATYDVRPSGSTNGFNMRGITYDAVSGNVIFCDTHSGSGGQSTNFPWSALYVLDGDTGDIKAVLNTNGITGGSYTFVVPGASDDGVIYVCNQTTSTKDNAFKIYRWPTADTNNPSFGQPPVVAYSG